MSVSGIVYVADTNNHMIRAIHPNFTVTTLAGGPGSGFVDGNWATARFNGPYGVAEGPSGIIYVADTSNHKVRLIFPGNRSVITIAGGSSFGSVNGFGTSARFSQPFAVAVDTSGIVYVSDYDNHKIRAILSNLNVITLAGSNTVGSINGIGSGALFFPTFWHQRGRLGRRVRG